MKRNLSDILVALAVIACSLALLGALTYALGGWKTAGTGRTLDVDFSNVTGIKLHSEVRYAGAPAGSVTAIRYLTAEERAALPPAQRGNVVRVSLELNQTVPALPNDLTVAISSDTLLSDKFIALSGGSADAPRLAAGALLQGRSGGSIDDLINSLGPFLQSTENVIAGLEPLLKKTGEAVDAVKSGVNDVLPKVSLLADDVKRTAATAEALLKRADKLIADNQGDIKADLVELRVSLVKMQDTFKTANLLLNRTDKNLDARMGELSVVLQNLKVVSTHAKAFTQAIGEKPNRLIFSGKEQPLPAEETILRSSRPVPAPARK